MDDLIDLGFRADVDATGGFIQQQYFHRHRQPAAENGLLLIAAREEQHLLLGRRRFDVHRFDLVPGVVTLPASLNQATQADVPRPRADVDVLGDAGQRHDAFFLAVLRAQENAGVDGVAR